MVQGDELLMQIDDIHSIKLPGTSGLVHIAYSANELDALHLNGWLTFNKAVCSVLLESLETLHLLSSTCVDLLWVILYAICAAAVWPKCSQHCISLCIGSSKLMYLLWSSSNYLTTTALTNSISSVTDLFRQHQGLHVCAIEESKCRIW